MKKIILIILILCSSFVMTGCSFFKGSFDDVSLNTQENEEIDLEQYRDSLVYSRMWSAWQYATDNGIPINNFKERAEVCDFIREDSVDEIANNLIYIYETENIHITRENSSHYKKSDSETELLYYGELNEDSEPEGLGILFEIYTSFYDLDPELFIRYIGYFENGEYDGYGIQFSIETLDDVLNISTRINWEILQENLTFFNGNKTYEGYFENGEYNGRGNYYTNNLYYLAMTMDEVREIDPTELTYDYIIGEFKNNEPTDDTKEY